jgi:hypothetical protein
MSKHRTFRWNSYADQPHNVAPKSERFIHHLKHMGSYLSLLGSNIYFAAPALKRYRQNIKALFKKQRPIADPFGMALTPLPGHMEKQLSLINDLGIKKVLIRIPSWEQKKLPFYEEAVQACRKEGIEVSAALLQNREDVLSPENWTLFLDRVFSRFEGQVSHYEIGHAWNRTKWGVWDFREYLALAEKALQSSRDRNIRLIGPAVIDFEFHLYPPVLKKIPFDVFSSLLYVDRMGAPENRQAGWDLPKKSALLKAIVDTCGQVEKELWITEMNWPLENTGRYSPVSGRPNVSEKAQADYLVRYYILCLATGFIDRIYWWQLVAPGYGLIDSREGAWAKRPSYLALKQLISLIRHGRFLKKLSCPGAYLFLFSGKKGFFLAGWTNGPAVNVGISAGVNTVLSLTGDALSFSPDSILLEESPKYIFFTQGISPDDIQAQPAKTGGG